MLDVWCWHLADVNSEVAVTLGVTTSIRKDTLNTTRYFRRNLCRSMRSYELDLRMDPVQQVALYVNSGTECWIFPRRQHWHLDTLTPHVGSCMGLCRILHDTHLSQPDGRTPVLIISKAYNFLFGSSTTSRLNYANTCSLNLASSLTLACLLEVGHPA